MISQLRVAVVCTQNLVSPKNLPHKELPPTSQAANDRIRLWIWSGVNLLGQQFIPSRKLSATKRRLAYSAGLSKGGVGGNPPRRAQRVPFGYFQTDTASTNTPALWCRCIRCTKCALRRHRAFRAAGAAVLLVRRNKNEGADNNENEREHV